MSSKGSISDLFTNVVQRNSRIGFVTLIFSTFLVGGYLWYTEADVQFAKTTHLINTAAKSYANHLDGYRFIGDLRMIAEALPVCSLVLNNHIKKQQVLVDRGCGLFSNGGHVAIENLKFSPHGSPTISYKATYEADSVGALFVMFLLFGTVGLALHRLTNRIGLVFTRHSSELSSIVDRVNQWNLHKQNIVPIETSSVELTKIAEALDDLRIRLHEAHMNELRITRELEEKKRLSEMSDLSARVAHDIRSPLSALNLIVPHLSELDDSIAKIALDATKRIDSIASSLLDVRRELVTPLHQQGVTEDTADLNQAVRSIVHEKHIEYADRKGLSILCLLGPNCVARLLSDDFKRVVSNLINNSIEANASEVHVVTVFDKDSSRFLLRIVDDGSGIDEAIRTDPGSGKSTKLQGSGLGLRQAKEFAESNGGSIEFEARAEGGTVVSVSLPARLASKNTVTPTAF